MSDLDDVTMSMITGAPLKRKLKAMIENPEGDAPTPLDPDSDFDDAPPIKKTPAVAPKPSVPACQKATPRIQACGEKQLDRCITAARDNGDHVRIVVISLSYRIKPDIAHGIDQLWRAEERDGTGYDVCPPHNRGQDDVGESEFLGLFYSGVCEPGLGDQIADVILGDRNTHVIVVDPAKGDTFARLAACVGALKVRLRNPIVGGALYKQLTKPKHADLRAALIKASKCKSDTLMRAKMREWYHEHL